MKNVFFGFRIPKMISKTENVAKAKAFFVFPDLLRDDVQLNMKIPFEVCQIYKQSHRRKKKEKNFVREGI